jgi:hypothetical protein
MILSFISGAPVSANDLAATSHSLLLRFRFVKSIIATNAERNDDHTRLIGGRTHGKSPEIALAQLGLFYMELEQTLELYDLVSDPEIRRAAAKTLKGFRTARNPLCLIARTLMSGWIHSLFRRTATIIETKENVRDQKPFTYQFIIERWADGLKFLGAGNGTGLLASGAALQYIVIKPEPFWIKVGAGFFLAGVLLFAFAFFILTILPLAIERFLASSDKTYSVFKDMMTDLIATNKEDGRIYSIFVLYSIFSFLCLIIGCLSGVLHVVLNELFGS